MVFLACIVGVAVCQKAENNTTKVAAAAAGSSAVVPAEDMQAAASSYDKGYKPKAKKVYYGYGGYPSHYPGSSYDTSPGYGDSYGYQAPAYESYGHKESYAPSCKSSLFGDLIFFSPTISTNFCVCLADGKSYDYKPKDYGYDYKAPSC